jgi:hypothetical protein
VCYCAQGEQFGVFVHFPESSIVEGRLIPLDMRGKKVIKAIKPARVTQSQTIMPVVKFTFEPAGR